MANKKQIIINILDILKRYTDENHRLSQKKIADILKKEYNMTVDRKYACFKFGFHKIYSLNDLTK